MTVREYRRRGRAAAAVALAIVLAYVAQSQFLHRDDLFDGIVLLIVAVALVLYGMRDLDARSEPVLTRRQALAVMVVILFVGAGMRLWDLAAIPQGVWFDEAENGLVATRILTDPGFKPIYISDLTQLPALFFYYLAGWIALLGSNVLAVRLASASLGLLTVAGVYLLGRELFGQEVGLVAALLLSVSRWHVNFSRFGMNGIAAPFFLVFMLYFLARGLRRGAERDFVFAGLALGLGLNTYLAFDVVPLLVLLWIGHHLVVGRAAFARKYWSLLLVGGLVAVLVVAPLVTFAARNSAEFFERTRTASLFTDKTPEEARQALWSNVVKHAEMFNVHGDGNGRHNLAGSPQLDDGTAALLLLGIAVALARARQPRFLLLVFWLGLLLLPGLLSLDFEAPQSYRSIGVVPVTALLAALPVVYAWQVIWRWLGVLSVRLLSIVATGGLVAIGFTNFQVYWFQQIWDGASWPAFSTQSTLIAREVNHLGPGYVVYLDPVFVDQPTIKFLAPQLKQQLAFDPAVVLPLRGSSGVAVFTSDQNQSWIEAVHQDYPEATFKAYRGSPAMAPILYAAIIPPDQVQRVQGLPATYASGTEGDAKPAFQRQDKGINFNWGAAPPLAPPFVVTWKGTLAAPTYGDYLFKLEGPGGAQLSIDETPLLQGGQQQRIRLAQGRHAIQVKAPFGGPQNIRLLWQPPGGLLTPIPADSLFAPPVKSRGLQASFYPNDAWAGEPRLKRIDPDVSKHYHLLPLPQPFTVEWVGKLDVPTTGLYRFGTQSIDYSWLWIDGRLVVDNSHQLDRYVEGAVNLPEGLHDLRIRFLDRSGHSFIEVYWTPPGGRKTLLPGERVFPPQGSYPERAGPLRPPAPLFVEAAASAATPESAPATAPTAPVAASAPAGPGIGVLPTSEVSLRLIVGATEGGSGAWTDLRGVAVDAVGNILAVDNGSKRIYRFDPTGKLLQSFGGPGKNDGQFVEPVAAAVDPQGNVLVLDSETGWIQRFAPDGTFVGKFGGPPAEFYHPRGLAVDSAGNVFVADTGTGHVTIFSAAGDLVKKIGSGEAGPNQLREPVGVALDPSGSLFVSESSGGRLLRFDASLQLVQTWSIPRSESVVGAHVAVAPDQSLYLTDPPNHRVIHLDPQGKPLDQLGAAGQLGRPLGIAVDATGAVYVADAELGRVFVFGQ